MAGGTLQIKNVSGHAGPVAGANTSRDYGVCKLIDTYHLHRLQGVRGRMRGMERISIPPDDVREHLPDHAEHGVELLEPDPLQ